MFLIQDTRRQISQEKSNLSLHRALNIAFLCMK